MLAGVLAVNAFAAQVTLDISGGVNGTLQDVSATFPEGVTSSAGIEFNIAPSSGPNYWDALLDASSNPRQLAVNVNLTGVTHLYSLVNTRGGVPGLPTLASVTLFATDSSIFTVELEGDNDIRSYSPGGGTDTINGTVPVTAGSWGTVNWFTDGGGLRLDALIIALPSDWSTKTLGFILYEDNGDDLTQRMFVSGVTADVATPEPATVSLVAGAALVMIGLRKRA